MTNVLKQNPNVFYHKHEEDNGEVTEIVIDFQHVVSFCSTQNEDEDNIELAVKYAKDSKAFFGFPNEEPLNRFKEEYNAYVASRTQLVNLATDMAKDIAQSMRSTLEKEALDMALNMTQKVQSKIQDEMEQFSEQVKERCDSITQTALSHQRNINQENETYLENMSKHNDLMNQAAEDSMRISKDLGKIVEVLEVVAPSSDEIREAEALEKEDIKTEISETA